MPNYKASASLTLIESYEAGSAEASKTFTFPAIDYQSISHLILQIDISVTAALALKLGIDTLTSAYFYQGRRLIAGAETLINGGTAANWEICSATLLAGANQSAFIIIHLGLTKAGANNRTKGFSTASAGEQRGNEVLSLVQDTSNPSHTTIEVTTSTSTWQTGTRMSLYKVKR